MATTMQCDIVSAEQSLFSRAHYELLVATGIEGEFGVMFWTRRTADRYSAWAGYSVLSTAAVKSVLLRVGWFHRVQPGNVTLLADTAVRADDIDEAQAAETARQTPKKQWQSAGRDRLRSAAAHDGGSHGATGTLRKLKNRAPSLKPTPEYQGNFGVCLRIGLCLQTM